MKFLNKKEQVIDLEITPYGKSLLARGRFKPEYYSFFDDDTLYASQYGGFEEVQNDTSGRIKEVPQLETQAFFYGAGTQVRNATAYHRLTAHEKSFSEASSSQPRDINNMPYVADDFVTIGTIPDRDFIGIPLGTSKLNSSHAPAWNITALEGFISGSSPYWNYPSGSHKVLRIPQIDFDHITYKVEMENKITAEEYYEFGDQPREPNSGLDGMILNVSGSSIILEIQENNADFEWENFDVEVYEVNTQEFSGSGPNDSWTRDFLVPLFFKKQMSQIQNGILVEPDELREATDSYIDSNYVEYYFDILVDDEIAQSDMCRVQPPNKLEGVFSQKALDCGTDTPARKNIDQLYDTSGEKIDPCEDEEE